jgi:hypothetical protein
MGFNNNLYHYIKFKKNTFVYLHDIIFVWFKLVPKSNSLQNHFTKLSKKVKKKTILLNYIKWNSIYINNLDQAKIIAP